MSIFQYTGRTNRPAKIAKRQGIRKQIKYLWEDLPENLVQIDGMTASLESVRLSELQIPTEYQRDYDQGWGNRLAREYDFARHDPMRVSRRKDGSLWVIDGQHRTMALRGRLGPKAAMPVTVLVFENLSIADEARLFLQWNGSIRRATRSHTFPAQVTSNDPKAVEVRRVADEYGYEINQKSSGRNGALLPYPLLQINQSLKQCGLSPLEETVAVIQGAFGDRTACIRSMMVDSIGDFVDVYMDHPHYSRDRLIKILHTTDLDVFYAEQKLGVKYVGKQKSKLKVSGRKVLLTAYNKRIQHELPEV